MARPHALLALIALTLITSIASASPTPRTEPVVILFREMAPSTEAGANPFSRAQRQKAMLRRTQLATDALLKTLQHLPPREMAQLNLRPYWLIHGAFANLNTQSQQLLLQRTPLVRAILPDVERVASPRPIRGPMSGLEKPFFGDPRFYEDTWGLRKIGVSELRRARPELNGRGIRVGVMDSGIDPSHEAFRGRIAAFKEFTDYKSGRPSDELGHGTHVAGTIAGATTRDTNIGVAPGATLLIAKVFGGRSGASAEQIVAAMQWLADPDGKPETDDGAHVVNGSFGGQADLSQKTPDDVTMCRGVRGLRELGVIGVFAAGNRGKVKDGVDIPGACPEAVTVGATDMNDYSSSFSGRGPARWRDQEVLKPDISAPGYLIESAEADGGLEEMSGTSMATPHVSGALALLWQAAGFSPNAALVSRADPVAAANAIVTALLTGSNDLGPHGPDPDYGWGRVDVGQAVINLFRP